MKEDRALLALFHLLLERKTEGLIDYLNPRNTPVSLSCGTFLDNLGSQNTELGMILECICFAPKAGFGGEAREKKASFALHNKSKKKKNSIRKYHNQIQTGDSDVLHLLGLDVWTLSRLCDTDCPLSRLMDWVEDPSLL